MVVCLCFQGLPGPKGFAGNRGETGDQGDQGDQGIGGPPGKIGELSKQGFCPYINLGIQFALQNFHLCSFLSAILC